MSRQQYTYDEEGNRLTQQEEVTSTGGVDVGAVETTEYGYDEASRLVGVKYADGKAALYQLDGVGNRVGERKGPSSMVTALTAAAFLAVNPAVLTNDVVAVFNRVDQLQTVTDAREPTKDAIFTWDEAGNLVRQETAGRDRRLEWDVKQTLTEVTDNGVGVGRYDYGADGLRSKRSTALESIEYVLDGAEVLAEAQGTTARRRYHYGAAALAVSDGAGTRALHLDALGSPTTETSGSQTVAAVRQYDAWGVYKNGTAPGWGEAKLGYTGHQYDEETGLVYARARYYDAEYGRFLSRDSYEGNLNSAPSLHRFTYAHGNPLRYTDETGHFVPLIVGGILLGAELGLFGGVIHQELKTEKGFWDFGSKEWGNVGKATAVGAAAGGAAAAVGAAALSGTTALSIGGAEGSALVSATVGGAAGAYVSGTGGALSEGASLRAANEQGAIMAPLGAFGGVVGAAVSRSAAPLLQRSMSEARSAVVADTLGGMSGDVAFQAGAIATGVQEDFSVTQTLIGAGVGAGAGLAFRNMQASRQQRLAYGAEASELQAAKARSYDNWGGEFLDEGPTAVSLVDSRKPRLPTDGVWTGVPGDSDFIPNRASLLSTDPNVVNVAPGTRIPFRRGDAVFDQFAWDEFSAPGLTGGRGDRRLMLDALAARYGMSRQDAALYVQERFLAIHHAGGDRVQLVPGGIHGWTGDVAVGVPHRGAASSLRNNK